MRRALAAGCILAVLATATAADATRKGRIGGAITGAVGGAVVGGPVGAVVGGVGGAIVGNHITNHERWRGARRRHYYHHHHHHDD